MMRLVRTGKKKVRGPGFLVTWDVDSRDRCAANRLQYFLFGRKERRRPGDKGHGGFVWTEGVRYIAQSAVFVTRPRLAEIEKVLAENRIDHDVEDATLG